ncbi:MAG: hypothetical protein R3B90_14200 [Planctomycetaceae bacterium]
MRKILWTLAASTAMTASVPWILAQDGFGPEAGVANTGFASTRGAQAFGTGSSTRGSQSSPLSNVEDDGAWTSARPFPGSTTSLPPAGSLSESSASRLFSREITAQSTPAPTAATARSAAPAGQTGASALEQFRQVSGIADESPANVVHAEYQSLPGQDFGVEQVSGTGPAAFPAREFPQTQSYGLPENPPARSTSSNFTITPARGGNRLIEPIATGRAATTTSALPTREPARPASRGVTFTRTAANEGVQQSGYTDDGSSNRVTRVSATEAETVARPTTPSGSPELLSTSSLAKTVRSGVQSPTVSVEWVTRSGINVGQECTFDLVVKNTGNIAAEAIEVTAHFPDNVRLVGTVPEPVTAEQYLGWEFARLEPGAEKVIKVTMVPTAPGQLDTRADVRFSGSAATTLTVAEPKIEVQLEGPDKVMIGEPASQTVVITNPGSGIATNVVVEAVLPPGLEHARGERLLLEVGSLNPGETRSVRLALAAIKGGKQVVQVQARGDGHLTQNRVAEVYVVAPSLTTTIDGPGMRYLGRNATYTVQVRNDGEIVVDNVRMMEKIPEGFEVVETDHGAQFDRANRIVNWFVGRLQPGQVSELKVTLRADRIGSFTHFVRASSEHGAISDGQVTTLVERAAGPRHGDSRPGGSGRSRQRDGLRDRGQERRVRPGQGCQPRLRDSGRCRC